MIRTPVCPSSWKARMRWSGIARPTWMSGEVTSIPSLTRSGRPGVSFSSSAPLGSTSTALRVSSETPMGASTLPLQSRSSVAPTTFRRGAAQGPPPDPEASPLRTARPPGGAGLRLLQRGSRDRNRGRDPVARPEPDPQPARRVHLCRQRPRAFGPARIAEPDPAALGPDLAVDEAGNRRDRGQALLRPPRRRPARDPPRALGRRARRPSGAGWLDDHAAVRQEHVHEQPALDRPQAAGGRACLAARAAVVEGPYPDRLPEHDLLRQRRLRGRAGGADLLPPRRRPGQADSRRSCAAGGDSRGSSRVRPGDEPGCGQEAARPGPAGDARPGRHQAVRLRLRAEYQAAAPPADPAPGRPGPRPVLRELRQAAARRPVRLRPRLRRRAQGLYDDRPEAPEDGPQLDRA